MGLETCIAFTPLEKAVMVMGFDLLKAKLGL